MLLNSTRSAYLAVSRLILGCTLNHHIQELPVASYELLARTYGEIYQLNLQGIVE